MRISLDERIESNVRKRRLPRRVVNSFYQIQITDLFEVLSKYSEEPFCKEEMLECVKELMDKREIPYEISKVDVGTVLSILSSLHRKYEEYSESEQKLLDTLFINTLTVSSY